MGKSSETPLKEAILWRAEKDGAVACCLCAHQCRIKPGHRGVCRVRENRDGRLYTLVYGRAIAKHIDPIEKKPLFHFQPGSWSYSIATIGCNFRCEFCQNWSISQTPAPVAKARGSSVPGDWLSPETVVNEAKAAGCRNISYTYTEPTIFFEYAYDTARLARKHGLMNVFVTNGYQTQETVEKMAGVIDAANVDLKSFSEAFYRELCQARLQPVLDTIQNMHRAGLLVEVTTLIIPGKNDTTGELNSIAEFLAGVSPEIPWHVSRFHPDYKTKDAPPTPSDTVYRAVELGKRAGLHYVYAGNLPGGKHESTVCPACGKTVIERQGFGVLAFHLEDGKCEFCGERLNIVM